MNSQNEYRWIAEDVVLAIHEAQLGEHGGSAGVRDPGLIVSALMRPQHAAARGNPDLFELAAHYALGVIKYHPFVGGNKRVGTVLLELFLEDNGYELFADDAALLDTIMAVAAGEMPEANFIDWVRSHSGVRPIE